MFADPSTPQPGDTFQIIVRVRIAGGYHIYGTNTSQGPFSPTSLTLALPPEVDPIREWIATQPRMTRAGERVYTDAVQFRRAFKVRLNAGPRRLSITGELLCQACNDDVCFPARKFPISTSVVVMSKSKE
jgi:DsbC/DsbD-like thiol-disulfide interchange protein